MLYLPGARCRLHKWLGAGKLLLCDRPLGALLANPGERGAATIYPILALVPEVVGIQRLSAAASAPASSPAQHSIACCCDILLDRFVPVCTVHLTHHPAQHEASMSHSLSKPRNGFRHYLAAPSWPAVPPRSPRPGKLPLAILQWQTHADLYMSRFLLIATVEPQLEAGAAIVQQPVGDGFQSEAPHSLSAPSHVQVDLLY